MRPLEGSMALGALCLALFFPFLQRVGAAGAEGEATVPGASVAIPFAGELTVGGKRVEAALYRVDEGPEAHLRRLLDQWSESQVHLHVEAMEGGFFLGVVDIHAGLHMTYTIRGRAGGGAEVLRGISRLLPEETERPRLLDTIELPEGLQLVSHIQDRVGEQEVETSLLVSEVDAEQLVDRLQRSLSLSPCDGAAEAERVREGAPASALPEEKEANGSLCGSRGGVELRLGVDSRAEGETWVLLRLARGLP